MAPAEPTAQTPTWITKMKRGAFPLISDTLGFKPHRLHCRERDLTCPWRRGLSEAKCGEQAPSPQLPVSPLLPRCTVPPTWSW